MSVSGVVQILRHMPSVTHVSCSTRRDTRSTHEWWPALREYEQCEQIALELHRSSDARRNHHRAFWCLSGCAGVEASADE